MNEEQIIDKVSMIDQWKVSGDSYTQGELDAIGQLLELYYDNKKQLEQEKEKNKDLEEKLKIAVAILTKGTYPEKNEGDNDFDKQFIAVDKIKEIINEYKNIKIPGVREFFEKIEKMLLEDK